MHFPYILVLEAWLPWLIPPLPLLLSPVHLQARRSDIFWPTAPFVVYPYNDFADSYGHISSGKLLRQRS